MPKKTKDKNPDAMVRVYVWVPPKLEQRLKREAHRLPRPYNHVSELIRNLIQQEYPEPEGDL